MGTSDCDQPAAIDQAPGLTYILFAILGSGVARSVRVLDRKLLSSLLDDLSRTTWRIYVARQLSSHSAVVLCLTPFDPL